MRSLFLGRSVTSLGFVRRLATLAGALLLSVAAYAVIDPALQMQTGNPTGATADANNHTHYLIQRAQYALDFNDTTHEANWVAWDYTTTDSGSAGRSSVFFQDTTLPAGFYQVLTTDYSGSGYDRGHMSPSADRTVTRADNDATFYMSNMVPQTPDNNQGVWASFETYTRSLAAAGNEILIISGPSLFGGSTIASGVAIPGYTWKIALVVPLGSGPALSRIDANTRVIAIKIPNIAGVRSTPWENFVTSVAQIEADTGYTFFTALPASVASTLRTVVDGQSAAGAPSIVAQPTSQTTVVGGSATFTVTANGDAPLTYQWLLDDVEIAGATSASLTLSNVQASDVGTYTVTVSNSVGSATSNGAALVVAGLPPSITASPSSQTVNAGSGVTFTVTASGSPTLTYQWRKDGVAISGNASAVTAALTLTNVQAADTGSYDVVVTNSVSLATSAGASLVVNAAAPTITGQPVARSASTGSNASFTVTATGTAPLTYQWRKSGSPLADGGVISGATTATLLLTGVSAVDAADYDVVVTNALGFVTSSTASLTVNPPPPSTVTWNFTDGTANPVAPLPSDIVGPGALSQGNNNGTTTLVTTTSASSSYPGFSGTYNAGAAARIGALNKASGGSAYFEFTLSPSAGKRLLASGISFGSRSTSTGPQAFAVFSSLDSFTTAIASGSLPATSAWALYTPAFTTVTGATDAPVTFRIYGYNGAGSPGANTANWRIDDVKLSVTTVFPPPVAPVVIATSPGNGATSATVTSPITITFNEAVSFTGSWFSITSAANGPIAASVTGGPTTFTLTPPSFFAYNDTITVAINTAQVVDQSTGTIHGTTTTNVSFATESYVSPTPPSVTTQPVSQSVNVGSNATFTVAASGTAPLTYQWRKGGVNITGNSSATTASLTLTSVTLADAGSFDCVVSNVAGSDVSHPATLTVTVVPPTITTQPVAQMVAVGGNASFTVAASGTAPFAFQWRKGGVPIAGNASATTATLTLTGVTHVDTATYEVVVSNTAGSATSTAAALVVSESEPSAIYWDFATASPTSGVPAGVTDGTVTQGNNNGTTTLLTTTSASSSYTGFSAGNNAGAAARIGALNQAAGGSAYFEFTFTPPAGRQFAASAISFGNRSTGTGPKAFALFTSLDGYATPIASGTITADSAWRLLAPAFSGVTSAAGTPITFRLFGYNGTGNPSANTANWRIDDVKLTAGLVALPPVPPSITTQPIAQTATVGDSVSFTVAAAGTAPFTYQWRKAGNAISDNASATTATLTLAAITTADAALYDCVVTNVAGFATSDSVGLTVNKAAATITLDPLAFTYDGTPHAATATTTPTGLTVGFTYDGSATAPTNAGVYAVVATIVDANYAGTATGSLTIAPASAMVALGNLLQTYSGTPKVATATTTPAGLAVALTYNGGGAPTNAGTYAVVATIADPNYTGSATGSLTIEKALIPVILSNLNQTFDGTPKSVTATTTPSGLTVNVTYDSSPTPPTAAGSYAVVASISNANYRGSSSATFVIAQANATIALSNLAQAYDGTSKSVTTTTTPAGLTVSVTYDGSTTPPTLPGSYVVVATITDPNYSGTASGTLVITATALVRHAPSLDGGLDGSLQMLTGESFALNSSAWVSGDILAPGMPTVRLNGHPTFAGTQDGTGSTSPANYQVTLNSNAVLRYLVRRTDPIAMPIVSAPPAPTGTRDVSLNHAGDSAGDFATLRNLTLNGNVGVQAIPAGTYGTFTVNGNSSLALGVVGATTPSVYNLQGLTLNASSSLQILGPVVLVVANGVSIGANVGASGHGEWLALNVANGGVTLNGNVSFYGSVTAPAGTVTINGNSTLTGGVAADRLTINGNGLLKQVTP